MVSGISDNTGETSYTLTHNPLHLLTKVVDNTGSGEETKTNWLFNYDAGDRLKTTTENISPAIGDFVIKRDYDRADNLVEIKAGDDSTVSYSYNARYDLTGIALPDASAVIPAQAGIQEAEISFGYDQARNRTLVTMPGSKTQTAFDPANRVQSMTIETAAGTEALNYAYDSNGNILSLSLRGSEATAAISETRYAYDSLNRLISWYDSLADTTTTYSYDKAGNLLEVKEGETVTKSFEYNEANQISSAGYAYDDNGNLTELPASSPQPSGKRLIYDSENRLIAVIDKETSQTIAN